MVGMGSGGQATEESELAPWERVGVAGTTSGEWAAGGVGPRPAAPRSFSAAPAEPGATSQWLTWACEWAQVIGNTWLR